MTNFQINHNIYCFSIDKSATNQGLYQVVRNEYLGTILKKGRYLWFVQYLSGN